MILFTGSYLLRHFLSVRFRYSLKMAFTIIFDTMNSSVFFPHVASLSREDKDKRYNVS